MKIREQKEGGLWSILHGSQGNGVGILMKDRPFSNKGEKRRLGRGAAEA